MVLGNWTETVQSTRAFTCHASWMQGIPRVAVPSCIIPAILSPTARARRALITASQYPYNPTIPCSSTVLSSTISSTLTTTALSVITALRGGELSDLVEFSYEWCTNLGNPAALVAGAVIATIYETMKSGSLSITRRDSRQIQSAKKCVRFLLLSAFALETMTIFSTTITGTMLLNKPLSTLAETVTHHEDMTPLMFLRTNFEFEYLTARLTFLQGLVHWLLAIALDHMIPSEDESRSTRLMNKFIAMSLFTTLTLIVAFHNGHMSHYRNYGHMLSRWTQASMHRFLTVWPPRPLALVFVPSALLSLYWGYEAMMYDASKEKEE
jgi:cytochrome bd-type quinol oxidase subunit 2